MKSLFRGFPIGFRDQRLGLFEDRDPGIYSKKGARCGIVTVNGTRESVILRGGIGSQSLQRSKNRKSVDENL